MYVIHRTTIAAKCPHGADDVYHAEFHVRNRTLLVESISECIAKYTAGPIFQEDLTAGLAMDLRCRVVTHGRHGRFDTECKAGKP